VSPIAVAKKEITHINVSQFEASLSPLHLLHFIIQLYDFFKQSMTPSLKTIFYFHLNINTIPGLWNFIRFIKKKTPLQLNEKIINLNYGLLQKPFSSPHRYEYRLITACTFH